MVCFPSRPRNKGLSIASASWCLWHISFDRIMYRPFDTFCLLRRSQFVRINFTVAWNFWLTAGYSFDCSIRTFVESFLSSDTEQIYPPFVSPWKRQFSINHARIYIYKGMENLPLLENPSRGIEFQIPLEPLREILWNDSNTTFSNSNTLISYKLYVTLPDCWNSISLLEIKFVECRSVSCNNCEISLAVRFIQPSNV